MQVIKALSRRCGCAGSPEAWLFTDELVTKSGRVILSLNFLILVGSLLVCINIIVFGEAENILMAA